MNPIPRVEVPGLRQFTATYSVAPSTPIFSLWTGSGDGSCVYSATAVGSSTTEFYAFYTLPASRCLYVTQWVASYTAGAVTLRGYVQGIRSIPG